MQIAFIKKNMKKYDRGEVEYSKEDLKNMALYMKQLVKQKEKLRDQE